MFSLSRVSHMLLSESTDSIFVDAEISVNSTLPAPRDITDMWYRQNPESLKRTSLHSLNQSHRRGKWEHT
nr:hypothetical protein [Tanacetum cinerariifolium]